MYIKLSIKSYQNDINLREFSISGEIIGTYDIEVILIDGSKIEVPKSESYKYQGVKKPIHIVLDSNVIELTESMVPEPFDNSTKMLFDMSQNKIIKKTQDQLDVELVEKTKAEILARFKPLIDAMTFQEIAKLKDESADTIFTDDEITAWNTYISEITKGNILEVQPEIPVSYISILN